MKRRTCGRIDDHPAHEWRGHEPLDDWGRRWLRHTYYCSGRVVIEGGHRAR